MTAATDEPPATADAGVRREFVTVDDERWTQCHASSVVAVGTWTVVAWFAGTAEGTPDNRIWLSRAQGRPDASTGHRWSEPVALASGLGVAHWNPVLSVGPDGVLWLFFKVGSLISEWVTYVTRSLDHGQTWEDVRELVPGDRSGGRGPVKNPPVLTPGGVWLAPGSRELWADRPRWDAFVDVSDDGGRSWRPAPIPTEHDLLAGAGHIQPSLWLDDGTVRALLRSTEGHAQLSESTDGGRSWSPAVPTGLGNNNSGLSAVSLGDGRVACVHNPGTESWGSRCPLVVSVSPDQGRSWQRAVTLDDGRTPVRNEVPRRLHPSDEPGFSPGDAGVRTTGVDEYSYPTAVVLDDALLVSYTWQRRGVVLATLGRHRLG